MVYPTKCTWGCRTCVHLFWRICSTIGSPREPLLVALLRAWSYWGRKVAGILGEIRWLQTHNTELKILAWLLPNPLQVVTSDLIGPEQTSTVKGRPIQDNLYVVREVIEGIKDGTEAVLINLDHSKAFDSVGHQFLSTVLETAGFKPEFHRWISMIYRNPRAVMQVNEKRLGVLAVERSVRRVASCLLLSMSSLWSLCSKVVGMRGHIQPCAISLLLALLQLRCMRTLMIWQSLCPTNWT